MDIELLDSIIKKHKYVPFSTLHTEKKEIEGKYKEIITISSIQYDSSSDTYSFYYSKDKEKYTKEGLTLIELVELIKKYKLEADAMQECKLCRLEESKYARNKARISQELDYMHLEEPVRRKMQEILDCIAEPSSYVREGNRYVVNTDEYCTVEFRLTDDSRIYSIGEYLHIQRVITTYDHYGTEETYPRHSLEHVVEYVKDNCMDEKGKQY